MARLLLKREQLEELLKISRRESPNEAVALLFGHINGEDWSVEEIVQTKNSLSSPYAFSISPEDLYQAYAWAESKGVELVGIFHSHVGDPYPSKVDLKYMKLNPVVWIIAGRGSSECRAYILSDGQVLNVEIEVMP